MRSGALCGRPIRAREGFAASPQQVAKIDDVAIAAGLEVGDEIVRVDGHDVTGLRCYLVRELLRVPPDTTVELGLARGQTVRVTARAVE